MTGAPLVGHAMDVFAELDDNGNHYVGMMMEYCVSRTNCISYMVKKCGLTEEEGTRLGVLLTFEEVERLGREKELSES
jgi:hypothetical protein